MNHEKVKSFLKALKTDPKAKSCFADVPEPETDADRLRNYAEIAKKLGYDVSEAELEEYLAEKEKALKEHTKAAEDFIAHLSADEMETVSGGDLKTICEDTFQGGENCWYSDGCDVIFTQYKGYICAHTGRCDEARYSEDSRVTWHCTNGPLIEYRQH